MRRQVDLDVVEEARVPEGVDVAREVLDLEELPGLLAEVRGDVVLRDPPVADDLDPGDRGESFGRSASVCGMLTVGPAAAVGGAVARGTVLFFLLSRRAGVRGAVRSRCPAVGARGARAGGVGSRRAVRLGARCPRVADPLGERVGGAEQAQRYDGHEHRADEQEPARKPSGLLEEKEHRQEVKLRGP